MTTETPSKVASGAHIRRILVPIDLSAESRKALRYAAALAKRFNAEMDVVNVSEIDYAIPGPALLGRNPFTSDDEDAQQLKQELEAEIGKSVAPTFHGRTGRAYDQICRFARERKADLVVMATHCRTGLKRLLLGSNAERVVQHSSSPVLIVRECERELLSDGEELRVRTILVPTDFSASSREALDYSLDFARQFGAGLVLFHSFTVPEFTATDPSGPHHMCASAEDAQAAAEDQMREFAQAVDFRGIEFATVVRVGTAAEQICQYADKEKLDLIVTSTHGRTGLMHVLIGSVAEHVVRYAHCPVLVVPERQRRTVPD